MATILEDFEDATLNLTITGTWARADDSAAVGTWSLKSAAIGANGTTDAVVTVPAQATSLSFYYRVSSELDYDIFHVLIDGVEVHVNSGNIAWNQVTFDVTGALQVTFRYTKDNTVDDPIDAAWVDEIAFTVPATDKSSTDNGTLIETANVAQVSEITKASSDIGQLVETRWAGEPQTPFGPPPSIRSTPTTAQSGASSYTISAPSGVVANDVLIGIQAADRGTSAAMTTPTGGTTWQLLDSLDVVTQADITQVIRVWWKRAGSSEPGTYTFNQQGASDGVCLIVPVKDASLTAVPLITRSAAEAGENVTTPGIDPSSGDNLELRLAAGYPMGIETTLTEPDGFTPLAQIQSRVYTIVAAAARTLQSDAATAPADFVASINPLHWRAGYTLAIAPAVTGSPQESKTAADLGTVVESATVTVQSDGVAVSGIDTATLSETVSAAADVASSDAATLGETAAIDAGPGSTDLATLAEATMLSVGWGSSDQATLAEALQLDAQMVATDTGALVESGSVAETVGPVSSDAAALAEAAAVEALSAATDSGTVVESAQVSVIKDASDSAQLVESAAIGLASSDSATLAEVVQAQASIAGADSAAIADLAVVGEPKFATDTGALVEVATVANLGREIAGLGPMYRRWSAGSPYRKYSAGEPRRAWGAGSPRT
ncbi:hypothetical protein ACQEVF_58985 [Nonomuraea polychroma]|uniref:hypothetical protein n=1 Tax=Nonomuraea polychroma TaxID=46176 RepID=UPI003D8AA80B